MVLDFFISLSSEKDNKKALTHRNPSEIKALKER